MSKPIAVYIITNIVNAKQYVGITKDLKRRWSDHRTGSKSSTLLKQAIKNYGVENFVFTHIADAFDWDCAKSIEMLLIKEKIGIAQKGVPCPQRGKKGRAHSEETKQKISASRIAKFALIKAAKEFA